MTLLFDGVYLESQRCLAPELALYTCRNVIVKFHISSVHVTYICEKHEIT